MFGTVIGWLDALNPQEGKEVLPILEEPFGLGAYRIILALAVALAAKFHPATDERGCVYKFLA